MRWILIVLILMSMNCRPDTRERDTLEARRRAAVINDRTEKRALQEERAALEAEKRAFRREVEAFEQQEEESYQKKVRAEDARRFKESMEKSVEDLRQREAKEVAESKPLNSYIDRVRKESPYIDKWLDSPRAHVRSKCRFEYEEETSEFLLTYKRIRQLSVAGDHEGIRELVKRGEAFKVSKGTKCLVIQTSKEQRSRYSSKTFVEVRILEGPHERRTAWVDEFFIICK